MIPDPPPQEWHKDGYCLSTDRRRLDLAIILKFLAEDSYWGQGMTLPLLERALQGSLPMGIYARDGSMAGFGRVVTDYAVFAYLRDVFVLPDHRGKGLATWLAVAIRDHPALATVSTWLLATKDAQTVYQRAGYQPVPHPEYYMIIRKPLA
ncbi:GNAT family N-acetyltransferase [Rhodoligotrophos defluvii]|uniref:GNAT family N-acetyltransferase n=1 Tax=Rhodoligotrophos defluvii TaxID=2561934 RepID=UPI0010C96353|nr:GNAT family N-acetyltransferase [Rhodoligotrophos defluvii]